MIKSSDVLKEALRLYIEDDSIEGCCDAINFTIASFIPAKVGNYWERIEIAERVKVYLKKYRPEHFSLYWWPIEDRATRIDVLNKCILDALSDEGNSDE